jgi:hypothetical protein
MNYLNGNIETSRSEISLNCLEYVYYLAMLRKINVYQHLIKLKINFPLFFNDKNIYLPWKYSDKRMKTVKKF